ncbi:phosphoglucosamine mutase, partial [bacterium]|nr:phosphoglucosamine mutase [bacterium]
MSKPVMISVSGIRGIVGEGLTPQLIVNFSAAVGSYYGKGRVMIGRDSRESGDMVKMAVFSGLMSVGCHPVDLGICPTPTVQMAVRHSDAVGGVVITASHNPVVWNALKLLSSEGLFLTQEEGIEVNQIVEKEQFSFVGWNQIGQVSTYGNAVDDHIDAILNMPYLDIPSVRKRRFRVAFDCVNGAGGTILPKLLNQLGCDIFPLNEESHGRFAHTPEPVPENLKDLCKHVVKNKADIGFAVDPDVDRLAIVAESGEPLGEEYTVTLSTKFILEK